MIPTTGQYLHISPLLEKLELLEVHTETPFSLKSYPLKTVGEKALGCFPPTK